MQRSDRREKQATRSVHKDTKMSCHKVDLFTAEAPNPTLAGVSSANQAAPGAFSDAQRSVHASLAFRRHPPPELERHVLLSTLHPSTRPRPAPIEPRSTPSRTCPTSPSTPPAHRTGWSARPDDRAISQSHHHCLRLSKRFIIRIPSRCCVKISEEIGNCFLIFL